MYSAVFTKVEAIAWLLRSGYEISNGAKSDGEEVFLVYGIKDDIEMSYLEQAIGEVALAVFEEY